MQKAIAVLLLVCALSFALPGERVLAKAGASVFSQGNPSAVQAAVQNRVAERIGASFDAFAQAFAQVNNSGRAWPNLTWRNATWPQAGAWNGSGIKWQAGERSGVLWGNGASGNYSWDNALNRTDFWNRSLNWSSGTNLSPVLAVKDRLLQCALEGTLAGRIACRLGQASENATNLLSLVPNRLLPYVPEECRSLGTQEEIQGCLEKFEDMKGCLQFNGAERLGCAKQKLGVKESFGKARAACGNSSGGPNCTEGLRQQAYSLAKFNLYSLEERAEALLGKGVSQETVGDFIATMELAALSFDSAQTVGDKQQILSSALSSWRAFRETAKSEILASDQVTG